MRRFVFRPLVLALFTSGISLVSTHAFASSFQLFEQDGASVGTYHAGYAAEAADASVAWYNPAGIPLIQNQQIATGTSAVMTSFKYKGYITVNTAGSSIGVPQQAVAQGGAFGLVPFLHYVAPLTERLGFGFSVTVPFGLETDYGRSTPVQYASTLSQVTVVDISPSLGYLVTDKFSVGAGLDLQKMEAEFDAVGTLPNPSTGLPETKVNSESINKANDTSFGSHFGLLYQFNPDARVGISYHTKVRHRLTGSSKLIGVLGDVGDDNFLNSSRAIANITLPPYTALSGYYKASSTWAFMASAIYTQWNVLQELTLQNVAGQDTSGTQSTSLIVTIPQKYSNTWQLSVGTNYYASERVMLRAGLGFDQTPVPNAFRNTRLPDNDRYIVAVGGHFQATKTIGLDLGYNHIMIQQARVNPPTQQTGALVVNTNGSASGGADVFSGQITWDIL